MESHEGYVDNYLGKNQDGRQLIKFKVYREPKGIYEFSLRNLKNKIKTFLVFLD